MCISIPIDYNDQLSTSLSSPHNDSQQQHSDHNKNSNAEPDIKSKPVQQESQDNSIAQEESQQETVESKEEGLPCSSPVCSATGMRMLYFE